MSLVMLLPAAFREIPASQTILQTPKKGSNLVSSSLTFLEAQMKSQSHKRHTIRQYYQNQFLPHV